MFYLHETSLYPPVFGGHMQITVLVGSFLSVFSYVVLMHSK